MRHGCLSSLGLLLLLVGCQQFSNHPPSPEAKQDVAKRPNRELHPASPQQRHEAEQQYQEIVGAYSSLNIATDDPGRGVKMSRKVKPILARTNDPIVLRELVILIFTQWSELERERGPQEAEVIGWSFEDCLARLVKINKDDAARELVSLYEVEECHWDGMASIMLCKHITRMGKKALPYLKTVRMREERRSELMDYIRRGDVYLP